MSKALQEVQRIADEVLFPAALAVDTAERVPESHLALLADAGLYGLAAPDPLTTLDLPDYASVQHVVEILAGGCLTTTFVWVQHHAAVIAAAETTNSHIRDHYLPALATGRRRAGLAAGAAVRPGPPLLRAERVAGGWMFRGEAPWISGWGMVDTLYIAGRDDDDQVVWALVDAREGPSVTVRPRELTAVNASRTVDARFDDHFVPQDRVTSTLPLAEHLAGDAESVRFTGSLALGVAGRAISMLGDDSLAGELDQVRTMLVTASPHDVPAARAAGAELALRAVAALAVHDGSRSVLRADHHQRLLREAAFLLVFGSRPAVKAALLGRLTRRR